MKLIAEIGINHNADMGMVKDLIDLAVVSGFDYVKFQKRNPEVCVPDNKKDELKDTPWGTMTYLDYKYKMELGRKEYDEIYKYCENRIKCFASVWDMDSALFMIEYTDIVKIPSALITDIRLLELCKELYNIKIMSTGMSIEKEIEEAVKVLDPEIIMHTNSCYPSSINELNLNYINWLKEKYPDIEIGYSGHEYGLTTTYAAAGMGATWIERHITLSHDLWGSDQKASIDPVGCIKLVRGLRDIEKALGIKSERILFHSEKKKREDLRK